MRQVRVLTWNLQGSQGLDIASVAAVVRRNAADVVALQEVQWRQGRRLATALSVPSCRWVLKHWPIIHRPEGLAVISPHPIVGVDRFVLRRAGFWAWRRRVGIDVTVATEAGPVRVVDVHLSPHDHDADRHREAVAVVARARRRKPDPIVVGDLNEPPGARAVDELIAAGWRDAWAEVHDAADDGATNWTAGGRLGRPPTQRIDYVLVPPGARVESAVVVRSTADDDDTDAMSQLSDHLPLVVTMAPLGGGAT